MLDVAYRHQLWRNKVEEKLHLGVREQRRLDVDYRHQLWRNKVEEKLHLRVREQRRLNTIGVEELTFSGTFVGGHCFIYRSQRLRGSKEGEIKATRSPSGYCLACG
jgi:hypothetical protein